MEFELTIAGLGSSTDPISVWDGDAVRKLSAADFNNMKNLLDVFGKRSATAQGLHAPITDIFKLRSTDQRIYLHASRHAGMTVLHGGLKVGTKRLFVLTDQGALREIEPTCVLDFYVHESCQRKGIGKELFEHFLAVEQQEPARLAYDRPSPKLLQFLHKHYGLHDYVPQNNNYVVFNKYFALNPATTSGRAKGRPGQPTVSQTQRPPSNQRQRPSPAYRTQPLPGSSIMDIPQPPSPLHPLDPTGSAGLTSAAVNSPKLHTPLAAMHPPGAAQHMASALGGPAAPAAAASPAGPAAYVGAGRRTGISVPAPFLDSNMSASQAVSGTTPGGAGWQQPVQYPQHPQQAQPMLRHADSLDTFRAQQSAMRNVPSSHGRMYDGSSYGDSGASYGSSQPQYGSNTSIPPPAAMPPTTAAASDGYGAPMHVYSPVQAPGVAFNGMQPPSAHMPTASPAAGYQHQAHPQQHPQPSYSRPPWGTDSGEPDMPAGHNGRWQQQQQHGYGGTPVSASPYGSSGASAVKHVTGRLAGGLNLQQGHASPGVAAGRSTGLVPGGGAAAGTSGTPNGGATARTSALAQRSGAGAASCLVW